jgi:excisionase family DNA binding protein
MSSRDMGAQSTSPHLEEQRDRACDVMTTAEAARFLRIGRNQLYDEIGRGRVPHQRIGRTIRLSRAALLRWLEAAPIEHGRSARR